jgi:hypothetical protein
MRRTVLGIGLILVAVGMAAAQPAMPAVPGAGAGSAAKKKVDYKLELKPSSKLKVGKVALAGGVAGVEPHRMFLENLEIMAPIAVTVLTKDPSHDIKVQLGKYEWDKNFSREGSTKGKTSLTFKLRTAGDLKILVSSPDPEPRPFQVVVWVGDVAKPVLPAVAVKKSAWKAPANTPAKAGSGAAPAATTPKASGNTGIIIAIVIVGVLIAAALFFRGRGKK